MASLVSASELPQLDQRFWHGRRVLVTGHTGFKGAWLCYLLHRLGANLLGVSLAPSTQPNLFELLGLSQLMRHQVLDIRDANALQALAQKEQPDIVLHLAAQALVRPAYQDPALTYSSNVMGTVNVLEAVRLVGSVRAALMVTTDKVYRNLEQDIPYAESAELGGFDPYSASKAACELVIDSYRKSFFDATHTCIVSARAGNVIGGGDWAQERLFPDLMRAWAQRERVLLRRPHAKRPWQHVLEPLFAYLMLAQSAYHDSGFSQAFNIGPMGSASVLTVAQQAQAHFGQGEIELAGEQEGPHEAGLLALDATKIHDMLGIAPRWNLETTVSRSAQWYRDYYAGESASRLCDRDIDAFLGA